MSEDLTNVMLWPLPQLAKKMQPKRKTVPFNPPAKIVTQDAQRERDEVMKELSKKRRATMTSELSQARIGRRQLGAGV